MGHRKLDVYIKSKLLVKEIYALTQIFPNEEKYILAAQMKRAAISVVSNIAEGSARKSTKEKSHFLQIATGSLVELEAQLEIAEMLGFIQNYPKLNQLKNLHISVKRLLNGYKRSVETQLPGK